MNKYLLCCAGKQHSVINFFEQSSLWYVREKSEVEDKVQVFAVINEEDPGFETMKIKKRN